MFPEYLFYFSIAVGLLFLLIMVLIVMKGLATIRRANDLILNGVETEGRIVDSWQKVKNGHSKFAPVVEYVALDGKAYRVKSNKFSNYPPDMGDTLPVYYLSADPAFGMVDPEAEKTAATMAIIIAPLIIMTGLGMMFFWFRMKGF